LLVILYSIVIIAMQIEYSSNYLKALISTANAPREGSLNAKIGRCIVDFLLVLIELFFLVVTA